MNDFNAPEEPNLADVQRRMKERQKTDPVKTRPDVLPDATTRMAEVCSRIAQDASESKMRAEIAEIESRALKVEALRRLWNAPAINLEIESEHLDRSGDWGRKESLIKSRIGKGFMFALVGKNGPGKTQLAVEAMRDVTNRLKPAYYLTAMEFFMEMKASYSDGSKQTELDVMKRFRKPSLLVIDELDKRSENEWQANLLFELLNKRYSDMTGTLLIRNGDPNTLEEAIGPSLVSRLNQTGGIIHCNWPSFRKPIF